MDGHGGMENKNKTSDIERSENIVILHIKIIIIIIIIKISMSAIFFPSNPVLNECVALASGG